MPTWNRKLMLVTTPDSLSTLKSSVNEVVLCDALW